MLFCRSLFLRVHQIQLRLTTDRLECTVHRPNRTARFLQLFNDAQEQLDNAVDFDSLDSPARIDWHLFRECGWSWQVGCTTLSAARMAGVKLAACNVLPAAY